MGYQTSKSKDSGVNNCESCLEKQRIIDRRFEEIGRLKQKLQVNRRKRQAGFFGSSTPSSQIPAENNYAEREIRKTVTARKMSYGSQSRQEAKTREIWTSILQTLKKREENPRDKLVETLNCLSHNENLDIAEELFGSPITHFG